MNTTIPRTLLHRGHQLNYTGRGRTEGSSTYLDAMTGEVLEVYFAQVEQTGPIYSLSRIANNPAIGTVRIDHAVLNGAGPANLGDILIVGQLQYFPEGPRATAVWRAPMAAVARTAPVQAAPIRQFG